MENLEMRAYSIGVLSRILGTKGKQATDRKLEKYGYCFTSNGTGTKRVYTITALPDAFQRFKSFCVFSLGFPPQTDFKKLRDFVFYLLSDENFIWRPDELMEEYLRLEGRGITRQTIAHYRKRLEENGIIFTVNDEFVYYKIYDYCGEQRHEIISREEYRRAWSYYFEWKNKNPKEDSRPAFTAMYNRFGGVPRKQKKIVPGAPWYAEEQDTLFELASNSILEEISG